MGGTWGAQRIKALVSLAGLFGVPLRVFPAQHPCLRLPEALSTVIPSVTALPALSRGSQTHLCAELQV